MGSVLMEYQDILDMKTTHAGPIPAKRIEMGEGQVIFVLSIIKGLGHEIDFKFLVPSLMVFWISNMFL
jgi:hypothetical protein